MTTAGLALALLATYVVLALVVRPILQLRRTGSTGVVTVRKHTSASEWAAVLLGLAGFGLAFTAPALVLLDIVDLAEWHDSTPLRAAGAVTMVAGIVLTFAAQLAMGASWRIGVDPSERTALVTDGLFGWIRNPIYTGMVLTVGGLVLLLPTVVAVAALATVVAAVEVQVRLVEEPYLRQVHGDEFAAYCRRVGRLLPKVGRQR
ncbi:methyltransferase family protein [Nocardioides speluncae]|uniref:methyltransferase family protein n=1 Tax=Nocardioides speluncae TaxID=2670337 RepID=UPI00197D2314|nr:isoprenylcysteine carboxylmethyltransferase family protein [Nocardioides speluncae]